MKHQIVADESVDFRIISGLRQVGLNVLAIIELQPSITDNTVLNIACENEALLLTEDKDFGELVFRLRLPHRGVLVDQNRGKGSRNTVRRAGHSEVLFRDAR